MKKLIAVLMVLMLAVGLLAGAQADTDEFTFELEKVIQDGETYWARGTTGMWVVLGTDDASTARFAGVYYEGEEDPECTWTVTKEGGEERVIVSAPDGKDYEFFLIDDSLRFVYRCESGRELVFVLRESSVDDETQPEDIINTTMNADELMVRAAAVSPVDLTEWDNIAIHYRIEDANCVITFTSKYGDFLYVMDSVTGELADKQEADIDAVRQQEDYTEGVDMEEAQRIAEAASGLDILVITDRVIRPEGNFYEYTFSSPYGDFYYKIDMQTGEIVEKSEPDVDAARAQDGFTEPATVEEALSIAEAVCPAAFTEITNRKPTQNTDGTYTVTLETIYGDCIYQIEPVTREVTVIAEPDFDAARQASGGGAPLDFDQMFAIAETACPASFSEITDRVVGQVRDNVYTITLTAGDYVFVYTIDALTGEITDKIEPEDYVPSEENRDVYSEAINAAAAVIPGFDYDGDIMVAESEVGGDRIITVTINWKGEKYEYRYSVNERKLIE